MAFKRHSLKGYTSRLYALSQNDNFTAVAYYFEVIRLEQYREVVPFLSSRLPHHQICQNPFTLEGRVFRQRFLC